MSTATHVRLNKSLLAASEKRLLIWIAERLPRWIHSDHLSALGLAAMAGAGVVVRAHAGRIPLPAQALWRCACCSTGSATASTARWPASATSCGRATATTSTT